MILGVFIIGLFYLPHHASAANRYWVGGSDGANVNDTANWASADPASCTGGGASVPSGSDIAIFDPDCDNGATIDLNWSVAGININSGYTGTVTQSTTRTLTVGSSNYTQAGGTFAGGDSTIDINGSWALSGGVFTSTSGIMTITTNFTVTNSPTFSANGGTITFDGGGGSASTLSCGNVTFNSVAISKSSTSFSGVTVGSNCTLPLGNSPTTTSGRITNNGTINIGTGTWTHNGGYSQTTGTLTFTGTTINMNNSGDSFFMYTSFTLSGGTFTATSLTTLNIEASLDNTGNLLPNGVALILDGGGGATGTITCGTESWGSVAISKSSTSFTAITFGSNCVIPLGNSPTTTSGKITNNGAITVGTGTWTHNGGYQQNTGSSFTMTGTNIDINDAGDSFFMYTGFTLSGGTFTAASLTTINVNGNLDNTANILPNGIALILDGAAGSPGTITCGTVTWGSVAISKSDTNTTNVTFSSSCVIPLGNSPTTTSSLITNNGTINVGTGTWTLNGGYTQTTGTLTFGGTTIDINDYTTYGTNNFTLAGGTFTAASLTTIMVSASLTNSGSLLPNGIALTIDGSAGSASSITCGTVTWGSVAISKLDSNSTVTIGSDCVIPLGNSPTTTSGLITNNGTINIGTGTWTHNGGYTQTTGTLSFSGTTMEINNSSAYGTNNFTLAGGTFTAASLTTINVDSSFTNSGNLLPNGVTLTLDGGAGASGTITCGTASFGSITVAKISDTSSTSAFSGNCTSTGNFTRTRGIVNNSGSASTVFVGGNFSMSTTGAFGGANLTIELNGTSAQTIAQNAANTFSSPLVINKSSNTATLTTNLTSASSLALTQGTFSQGATFNLTTGGAITVGASGIWTNTGTGDITLGGNVSNSGTIILDGSGSGCGGANAIILSDAGTTQRTWSGAGTFTLQDLDVSDMTGSMTAVSSTDTTNNSGWTFIASCNTGPNLPSSLGPASFVNGSWSNDSTPTLTFTLSDPDGSDTVKFKIQIDDTSSFSSVLIDYTSTLAAQGSFSFTVGQAAGSGTYTTGAESQTLTDGAEYYWKVKAIDNSAEESGYTAANSGSIAFKIDATPPAAGTLAVTINTRDSLTIASSGTSDSGSGLSATPYLFHNLSTNTDSGSISANSWESGGLTPATEYTFDVLVSDAAGNTATSPTTKGTTEKSNSSGGGKGAPPAPREPPGGIGVILPPIIEIEPSPLPWPIIIPPDVLPPPPGTPPPPTPNPKPILPPEIGGNEAEEDNGVSDYLGVFDISKEVGEVIEIVSVVAITTTLLTSLTLLLNLLASGTSFFNYLLYLLIALAQFLGMRRKPAPWGTVFDSVSLRPVPFARVEILNQNARRLESVVTDAEGRYGFLVRGEALEIKVHQNQYTFPPHSVLSPGANLLYPHLYQGGLIDSMSLGTGNFDLPMEPVNSNAAKKFYPKIVSVKLNNLLTKVADGMFVIGAILGVVSIINQPNTVSYLVLALIVLVFILRKTGMKLKPFGLVRDRFSDLTLPFSLIALHNNAGERVAFTVSDDLGRYFLLTESGQYLLRAYTPSYISPMRQEEFSINARDGWVSREIGI